MPVDGWREHYESCFFSSRRRHTRCSRDWSSDVCSSDLNWQAGIEGSLSTFMASVVMSDMLLGCGFLHGSRIWSYAEMMMDCEIFSIVHKMIQGIVVDEETLALDAIAAVGPGGHFLAQKHTRKPSSGSGLQ